MTLFENHGVGSGDYFNNNDVTLQTNMVEKCRMYEV